MAVNKSYAEAGVSVAEGYRSVELIKEHVRKTFTPGVVSDIGGFGGMFSLADIKNMDDPVMVSGTDGVGTKLEIARMMDKHDTIGIDCVAMCVNDIVCCGAKPLFFLDYIACGRNVPERIEQIVKGVSSGCIAAGAALVGGETAEHPGVMSEDEYDIAGFAAGIVDKKGIIDGRDIKEGDVLIGIASSGLHSNGFSLVRKIFGITDNRRYFEEVKGLNMRLGHALLIPTRVYVKPILSLIQAVKVKGISNITGGGWYENIPRMLPEGFAAHIETARCPVPRLFEHIQKEGNIPVRDMYYTFNMGTGMFVCVDENDADAAVAALEQAGERAYLAGRVAKEGGGTRVCLADIE